VVVSKVREDVDAVLLSWEAVCSSRQTPTLRRIILSPSSVHPDTLLSYNQNVEYYTDNYEILLKQRRVFQ
jgi:hypothetical protein